MTLTSFLVAKTNAATTPYFNPLNSQSSLDSDFYKYESGSGTFGINNGRLEFATTTAYVGVREFKYRLDLSSNFAINLSAHVNPLLNYNLSPGLSNGQGSELAAGMCFSKEKYVTTLDDYINRDAIKLKRSYYNGELINYVTDAFYTSSSSTEKYWTGTGSLGSLADVDLKATYDSQSNTLSTFWRSSGETSYTSLKTYNLFSEWGLLPGDQMTLILYSLATRGDNSQNTDLTVTSGDVFLSNINIVPEPSAFSLLAVGLGGLAMFRRRRRS